MTDDPELLEYLKQRDALLNNPTMEGALKLMPRPKGGWVDPQFGPLAAVHKARLHWIDVTDKQIDESMKWLKEHNYSPKLSGIDPLTPETRNIERQARGLEPL